MVIEMNFDYCKTCTTGECDFPEIDIFISHINKKELKEYKYMGCPDKQKLNSCTADFQFEDSRSGDILTIEVKRLLHGFQESKQKEDEIVARMFGMYRISSVVSKVLEDADRDVYKYISGAYKIKIPALQFDKNEMEQMYVEMLLFITNSDFTGSECIFNFIRNKGEIIEIQFIRLSDEDKHFKKRMAIDNMLLEYPTQYTSDGGISFEHLFKNLFDFSGLMKRLKDNLEKSNNSFWEITKGRIVLQVLVLKFGMDITFFSGFADEFFSRLKSEITRQKEDILSLHRNFDKSYICISSDFGSKVFEIM